MRPGVRPGEFERRVRTAEAQRPAVPLRAEVLAALRWPALPLMLRRNAASRSSPACSQEGANAADAEANFCARVSFVQSAPGPRLPSKTDPVDEGTL